MLNASSRISCTIRCSIVGTYLAPQWPQEKHTYDNWYYNISHSLTIEKNVQASIDLTRSYIGAYVRKNGNNYLFVVSLTRLLFVNEQIACTEPLP